MNIFSAGISSAGSAREITFTQRTRRENHAMNAMNFKEHIPPNEHILRGYFLCGLCERNNFHAKNAKGKSREERNEFQGTHSAE
jgi:hypothetical protein